MHYACGVDHAMGRAAWTSVKFHWVSDSIDSAAEIIFGAKLHL